MIEWQGGTPCPPMLRHSSKRQAQPLRYGQGPGRRGRDGAPCAGDRRRLSVRYRCTGEPNGGHQELKGPVGGDSILGGQPGTGGRGGGNPVPLCPASAGGAGGGTLCHSPLARRAHTVFLLRGLYRRGG